MQFRDPRILAPGDKELDVPIKAAADLIVAAVIKFADGHNVPTEERGFWSSLGEMRALDLIDATFARRRDTQEAVAGRTLAEREHDVAIERVRRDLEQLLRTGVAVAIERGENPSRALIDQGQYVWEQTAFLQQWVGEEIVPDLPDAGV